MNRYRGREIQGESVCVRGRERERKREKKREILRKRIRKELIS